MAKGVAAGALITAYITATLLWIEGWVVALAAVLHTHSRLATLAVVLALFLFNALLVLFIASGFADGGDMPDPREGRSVWWAEPTRSEER